MATERHAGKIYTMAMFEQFGHIIYECGAYQVEEIEKGKTYMAIHMDAARREKWCRVSYKVAVVDGGQEFDCECGQFSHMGMLCSHVLKVLDFIRVTEIPQKHIVKRWTRDARDILPAHLSQYQRDNASSNNPFSYRHFNMYMQAMELVRMGDASVQAYERLIGLFKHCAEEMKPLAEIRDGLGLEDRMVENGAAVKQANGDGEQIGVNGKMTATFVGVNQTNGHGEETMVNGRLQLCWKMKSTHVMSREMSLRAYCHQQRGRRRGGLRLVERKRRTKV